MARNKKNSVFAPLFLYVFLPLLAIGISSFAIFRGVQNYITSSNYFKVRELKVEGITDLRYLDLMKEEILGTNIFRIDAQKLAERIRKKFPTFDSVTVSRVLPSQLAITAKERLPVAVLKRDLYYVLDTEGVPLSSYASGDLLDFPLIVGLEGRVPRVKLGVAGPRDVLERPLLLARSLRVHKRDIDQGNAFRVTRIDATDLNNLTFYLGENLQIRVGHQDIENRVSLLPAILHSISQDLPNVKYIDLRPKEPVVATKDNEKQRTKITR